MHKIRLFLVAIVAFLAFIDLGRASQDIKLTAAAGYHQFPFFDVKTAVWQYNGETPGPVIRARAGRTLNITLNNQLKEPTTIHWHGLRIENSMDGVPGVTQDPVKPGDSFIYRLGLQEAGTYWYHPHFNNSEQMERGLKGVLIVEEEEPLPWSQEIIMLLDDWLLQKDGNIFPQFNTPHDLMHDGRWGNVVTVNGKVTPEFSVRPGERVRLRLINGANARIISPNMTSLSPSVISVDGRPVTQIFPLDKFHLSPGNRLDLDITIPTNAAAKVYTLEDSFPRNKYPLAKLKVSGETPVETPEFEPLTADRFIPAEIFEDVEIGKTWELSGFRGGKLGIGWGMNQKLWPESDPADFPLNLPTKIAFKNSSSRLHPMHIHGVFFRVLERNGEAAVEPFTRDTVLVGPKESVVIGLVPEHKGIWAAHCHILEHAEAGMMTTINVGVSETDSPETPSF